MYNRVNNMLMKIEYKVISDDKKVIFFKNSKRENKSKIEKNGAFESKWCSKLKKF